MTDNLVTPLKICKFWKEHYKPCYLKKVWKTFVTFPIFWLFFFECLITIHKYMTKSDVKFMKLKTNFFKGKITTIEICWIPNSFVDDWLRSQGTVSVLFPVQFGWPETKKLLSIPTKKLYCHNIVKSLYFRILDGKTILNNLKIT